MGNCSTRPIVAPNNQIIAHYRVGEGNVVKASIENMPPAAKEHLYLVNAAGLTVFREVYDELSAMGFYNVNPESMKELQSPDAKELLSLKTPGFAGGLA